MSAPESTVVRTWNCDSTTNVMGLAAAVENVARNQAGHESATDEGRQAVRTALLAGETLRTHYATFVIEG
jgi:hypothetical protein